MYNILNKTKQALAITLVALFAVSSPLLAQSEENNEENDFGIRVISIDPSLTGETGIVNTLVADTLPQGKWSFAASYYNWDREITDFDVNQLYLSIAYGLLDNLEVSASFVPMQQTTFRRPVTIEILPPPVLTSYPFPQGTIEEGIGDVYLGAKYAFTQGSDSSPGFALRGWAKIATADELEGFGSGEHDFGGDLILSQHIGSLLLAGNLGYAYLGTPELFDNAGFEFGQEIRYGVGARYFVNQKFRVVSELTGVSAVSDDDFPQEEILDLKFGVEYKAENDLRFGIGYSRSVLLDEPADDANGAYAQFSFSPWRGKEELAEARRRAEEERDRLAAEQARRKAEEEAQRKAEEEARRKAEEEARRKAEEEARKRAEEEARRKELETFQPVDVVFDLDEYVLSETAKANIDNLIENMKARPMVTVTIEGHCCYIGTDEYNLALGQNRANAIRVYMMDKGIADTRISIISYGESRPAFDNSTEETRRFNRRGHFVLKIN